jgi:hypothetical protein
MPSFRMREALSPLPIRLTSSWSVLEVQRQLYLFYQQDGTTVVNGFVENFTIIIIIIIIAIMIRDHPDYGSSELL